MLKTIVPTCAFVILLLVSCENDPAIESPAVINLPSSDEMMVFTDADEFLSFANSGFGLDSAKEKSQARATNFKSLNDLYLEASEKLLEVKTIEEQNAILKEYDDVIYLEDEAYKPRISNTIYSTICNRDRIYRVGDYFAKVLDNEIILTTEKSNYTRLKNISNNSAIDSAIFKKVYYQDASSASARVNAECPNSMYTTINNSESRCKNQRRVTLGGKAFFAVIPYLIPYYYPFVTIEIWGEKRNWVCNWNGYNTNLEIKTARFGMYSYLNVSTDPTHSTLQKIYYGRTYAAQTWYDTPKVVIANQATGEEIFNQTLPPYTFQVIDFEFRSRGVVNYGKVYCIN